jgi:nucleoside-diphosphate-sugar epimerase
MAIAKILVTGASGFVGRHILKNLAEFSHPQLQVVAATRDADQLPASYHGEVRVGDLRDTDYLDRVLAGIDIICHAAGWTNFHGHEQESRQLYLEPTLDLINRAKEWRIARFVNLSSIGVTSARHRARDNAAGTPRRGCAMFNCMIAVEDYLKTIASERMSVINLRAGIYCDAQLRTGLLPLLLQRPTLPLFSGTRGYMPLIGGQDLAQAFVRAALLPNAPAYTSLNIVGPDVPTQSEVMSMIDRQAHTAAKRKYLPAGLAMPLHKILAWHGRHKQNPLTTCSITALLQNPEMNSDQAKKILGYQPHIGWQTAMDNFLPDWRDCHTDAVLHAAIRQ